MTIDTEHDEQMEHDGLLSVASDIAARYQLSSIQPLIESSRELAERDEISMAVVGRFKAGKSSFLNHFLEREVLPVGVVPVTTAVTEIGYGPKEEATVHFLKGEMEVVGLDEIRSFRRSAGILNKKQQGDSACFYLRKAQ